jgi:hypothetical protein
MDRERNRQVFVQTAHPGQRFKIYPADSTVPRGAEHYAVNHEMHVCALRMEAIVIPSSHA